MAESEAAKVSVDLWTLNRLIDLAELGKLAGHVMTGRRETFEGGDLNKEAYAEMQHCLTRVKTLVGRWK